MRSANSATITPVRRNGTRIQYIQRTRTGRWKARGWHPVLGTIYLGLWRNPREARAAVESWYAEGGDPLKGLPPRVKPKYVREIEPGVFVATAKLMGAEYQSGEHSTAAEAHTDVVAKIIRARNKRRQVPRHSR